MPTPIPPRPIAPTVMLFAAAATVAATGLAVPPPPPPPPLPTPPTPADIPAPPPGVPDLAPPLLPSAPAINATVRDLAFLSGRWQSRTAEGAFLEEHWSDPEGPSMMGMFRWLHPGGAPALFEILTLTDDPGGFVALRLRHFSPTLEAKEEKDKPMTLRLVELDEGRRAVFLPVADAGQAARVIYERPDPNTLLFTLHFIDEAGREPLRLSFTRDGAAPSPRPDGLAADK